MRCRRPCGQGCASRRPRWAERAWRSGSGSSGSGSGSGSGSSSGSSSSSGSRCGGGGDGSSSSSSGRGRRRRRRRSSSSSSWLLLVLLQRSPRGLAPVRRLAHVKDQGESICVQTPSSGKNRHGAWSINNDNGNAHTHGRPGRGRSVQLPGSFPVPPRSHSGREDPTCARLALSATTQPPTAALANSCTSLPKLAILAFS